MSYQIEPIVPQSIRKVAEFQHRFGDTTQKNSGQITHSIKTFSEKLQHRLVNNPFRVEGVPLGHCVRDENNHIMGTNLIYPWRFRWGDHSLLGLGSGGLFVDSKARMQGFLLYRRFLSIKMADFWYATTCNLASGQLWARSKAIPVPHSDVEFLLTLRLGSLAEEIALRKNIARPIASAAGAAIGLMSPLIRHRRLPKPAKTEPTRDWQKLADIAERHRQPNWIVCDRTPTYLQWSYEQSQQHRETFLLEPKTSELGWFALEYTQTGHRSQIKTAVLIDWAIPKSFDFQRVLATAVAIVNQRKYDVLRFRWRFDLPSPNRVPGVYKRTFSSQTQYVIGKKLNSENITQNAVISLADQF
jgi:hypothetical protein